MARKQTRNPIVTPQIAITASKIRTTIHEGQVSLGECTASMKGKTVQTLDVLIYLAFIQFRHDS